MGLHIQNYLIWYLHQIDKWLQYWPAMWKSIISTSLQISLEHGNQRRKIMKSRRAKWYKFGLMLSIFKINNCIAWKHRPSDQTSCNPWLWLSSAHQKNKNSRDQWGIDFEKATAKKKKQTFRHACSILTYIVLSPITTIQNSCLIRHNLKWYEYILSKIMYTITCFAYCKRNM